MGLKLHSDERRVLGVLIEKSLAQPDYYPMTLNALVAACNQKQNRDPVLSLDDDSVYTAFENLREQGLATMMLPGGGTRTKRFRHDIENCLGWQKRERAVMAELLLRGPQTEGELRTRCSRMIPFDDLQAVAMVLDCLAKYEPPLAKSLPRAPGQSAIRFTHLIYPDDEQPATESSPPPPAAAAVVATDLTRPGAQSAAVAPPANLESRVRELETTVDDLQRRLHSIESQLT